ncbi:MAG: cobalt ECF transporter T component CbiQ [Pseudomonadota bacterium]
MLMEEFATGNTWVHDLDPRVKICITLVFSIVTALNHHLPATAVSFILPLVLVGAARLDPGKVFTRLAPVNAFVLFMWLVLPFTTPGETIFAVGPLSVQREGVISVLLITLKSNSIMLMVIALLGTSQIFTLVHALSHLWVPDKLVHLFFFCFRYVHVIHDEYHRLTNAMKMRGFRPRTDMHTYRAYGYLVGMLLVRSFDRSRRILEAMKCRGFKGKFYILHHYRMKHFDYALAGTGLGFSVLMYVAR